MLVDFRLADDANTSLFDERRAKLVQDAGTRTSRWNQRILNATVKITNFLFKNLHVFIVRESLCTSTSTKKRCPTSKVAI